MAVSEVRELAKRIECEFCKAAPNQPCVTLKGAPAKEQHEARSALLQEAWESGYSYGTDTMLDEIAERMPWAMKALAERQAQYMVRAG